MHLKSSALLGAATFAALSLLGAGNVSAAPRAKNSPTNKANRTRLSIQETRLFATGAINSDTSSIKAISTDNHFTWVWIMPTTVITQRGKSIAPGSISEGDKLLCQGAWAEDAWGPVFQANRIEVLGNIGEASLQAKVAVVCQSIQSGSSDASGSGTATDASSSATSTDTDSLWTYVKESDARGDVSGQALNDLDRLARAADDNLAMRHSPAAVRNIRDAVARYKKALDAEDALSPIPPELRVSEQYERQAHQQLRAYANIRLQYFCLNSYRGHLLVGQALEKARTLMDLSSRAAKDAENNVDTP